MLAEVPLSTFDKIYSQEGEISLPLNICRANAGGVNFTRRSWGIEESVMIFAFLCLHTDVVFRKTDSFCKLTAWISSARL